MSMRIDGTGRLGGDGVAFWYAAEPGVLGKAFGSKEQWKGLGVFVDTFDNDGKRDNPYISVVVNDGTKTYSSATDAKDIELGGCRASVRKADSATVLRVAYRGSTRQLDVAYDLNANGAWRPCFSGIVDLPLNYYLGVSAATGGVSDNHDINYLELRRLDMAAGAPTAAQGASFFPPGREPGATAERRSRELVDERTAAPDAPPAPEMPASVDGERKQLEELRRQIEELRKARDVPPVPPVPPAPAAATKEEQAPATTTTTTAAATATVAAPAAGSVAARMAALEQQLGELNGRLAAVDRVTESVHRVTAAMEQLKQQLGASANKPAAKYDDTLFVSPSHPLLPSLSTHTHAHMFSLVGTVVLQPAERAEQAGGGGAADGGARAGEHDGAGGAERGLGGPGGAGGERQGRRGRGQDRAEGRERRDDVPAHLRDGRRDHPRPRPLHEEPPHREV